MSLEYFADKVYDSLKASEKSLPTGEYEACKFRNCDLANADLSHMKFIDTEFVGCNLSNSNIADTFFQDVIFKDCKMLGMRFDECSDFRFACDFDGCQLESSSFLKKDMKHTRFNKCDLGSVDLGEADLEGVSLNDCSLVSAMFERTNLTKADLTGSSGFVIDPEENRIKGAKISLSTVQGLLQKYGIIIENDT